jgi:hypothetical protein
MISWGYMAAANSPVSGLLLLAGIPNRYPPAANRHHLFIHKQKGAWRPL